MNPSFNPVDSGKQTGTAPVNKVDNPRYQHSQGLNKFDLSYQNLFTARYGEITPFFDLECVGRDRVRLRNSYDLRSYTLSSPLLSSLRLKKSYFQVPLSGIMPNTWQYIFSNPVRGNDVPNDVYCQLPLNILVSSLGSALGSADISDRQFLLILCLLSCILSKGSLLNQLGYKINFDFDERFESAFSDASNELNPTSVQLTLPNGDTYRAVDLPSFRTLFYLLIQYPSSAISTTSSFTLFRNALASGINLVPWNMLLPTLNVSKLVAYHFVTSQFYSNDSVDPLYNSELWLANQKALLFDSLDAASTSVSRFFLLNGTRVEYDVFSAHYLNRLCESDFVVSGDLNILYFFLNLFSFDNSLRYGDYFTGARTQPLAVGNTVIDVSGSSVSVVDVNKSLHIQRFLNACNRVGNNIYNYVKGIFGYELPKDYHQPNFIASETDYIGGQEVENTAQEQGNIVTNLRSQKSNYEFEVEIDNPCILLGLMSFECTPAYPFTISRDFLHFDRYDYFNVMMQGVGDQQIYLSEFNSSAGAGNDHFGYQTRYAEYKHRYNVCSGGFVLNLPSWGFVREDKAKSLSVVSIHSQANEFDRFYSSLSYLSMAGYFHFIVSIVNNCEALRPMDMYPSLV